MKTISEISAISGVSIRTLRYYDQIGLLKPSALTQGGYRLYDESALERLQQILIWRELQFPLKEIRRMLDSPAYDVNRALHKQAQLLTLKKEHLENLITFTRGILIMGVNNMDFTAFDTKKLDEYSERAKESWGKTEAWQEFEQKQQGKTRQDMLREGADMMQIFAGFGEMLGMDPASEAPQRQVELLRQFICDHYYNCTVQILSGLGKMYAGGGEMTENIDRAGGAGTAVFAAEAVRIYCEEHK